MKHIQFTDLFLLTATMTDARHHRHPGILKKNYRKSKYCLISEKFCFFKDNRVIYRIITGWPGRPALQNSSQRSFTKKNTTSNTRSLAREERQ